MIESFSKFLDRNEKNSTFSLFNKVDSDPGKPEGLVVMLPELVMDLKDLEKHLWENYQIKIQK